MGSDSVARRGRRPGDLRVVVRRPAKLPRTLGPSALFAACYGNVGSSIYYALGVTAAFALGLTPLALILAGFIFVTTALNYAEGTAALPHAGGSSSFARRAFNAPIGFIVGWVQLLNYTATVSISSYFAISYLGFLGKYVPALAPLVTDQSTHVGATVVLIAILVAVNVIGIQESSALNLVLAFTDLVTQLVLVILGIILLLKIRTVIDNIHWGVAPTWSNFLAGISIAMVTYTGIETISNLSEEAKDPGRNVPLATWWVIIAVLFVSALLSTLGGGVVCAPRPHRRKQRDRPHERRLFAGCDLCVLLRSPVGDAPAVHRTGAASPVPHAVERQVRARQHPRPFSGGRAFHRHGVHAAAFRKHIQHDVHIHGLAGARCPLVCPLHALPPPADLGAARRATAAW